MPNEYLYYYYFTRDAVASIRGSAQTRGEFLLDQQRGFYDAVAADPAQAASGSGTGCAGSVTPAT